MTRLSADQMAYLSNASLNNPTIRRATALSHNSWLAKFLADDPMARDRFRPVKGKPGDDVYVEKNAGNPLLVQIIDGKTQVNILLPFALLAPTGEAMNSAAAIDDFVIVATAVQEGAVTFGQPITTDVMEVLADKVHQGWCKREEWRKGDPSYDALSIPYSDLPDNEKAKDRDRVLVMFGQMEKDFPS